MSIKRNRIEPLTDLERFQLAKHLWNLLDTFMSLPDDEVNENIARSVKACGKMMHCLMNHPHHEKSHIGYWEIIQCMDDVPYSVVVRILSTAETRSIGGMNGH